MKCKEQVNWYACSLRNSCAYKHMIKTVANDCLTIRKRIHIFDSSYQSMHSWISFQVECSTSRVDRIQNSICHLILQQLLKSIVSVQWVISIMLCRHCFYSCSQLLLGKVNTWIIIERNSSSCFVWLLSETVCLGIRVKQFLRTLTSIDSNHSQYILWTAFHEATLVWTLTMFVKLIHCG
jgi:hypothetical protein